MKKLLILVFSHIVFNAIAQKQRVELRFDDKDEILIESHGRIATTINLDDNSVEIKTDSNISMVYVVVKDERGSVVHNAPVSCTSSVTKLNLSTTKKIDSGTIDLYYDDKHLIGKF